MRRTLLIVVIVLVVCVLFLGCEAEPKSKIEGVGDECYLRGIEFIEFMEETPMIGEKEGEDLLNAIAVKDAPDTEALFEDAIYIMWIYHNLKCVEIGSQELNQTWASLGIETTVQKQYEIVRDAILNATTQQELQNIWDTAGRVQNIES